MKKAFRREIARYHPDKVQHLAEEFQALAAARAAELTEAYGVLGDEQRRARYDDQIRGGTAARTIPAAGAAQSERAGGSSCAGRAATATAEPPGPRNIFQDEFLKRAALDRLREAVDEELGAAQDITVRGFEFALSIRGRRALFKKAASIVLLGRFVARVDSAAVEDTWPLAVKMARESDTPVCVFLMGHGLASARELSDAIGQQRRRQRGLAPVVIPIDLRNWQALMPADAPPAAKAVLERVRTLV